MRIALLIDFGSTYTKVTAVDLDLDRFIGRAQAPSTVDTDVTQGLLRAIQLLKQQYNLNDSDVELRLACSSADRSPPGKATGSTPCARSRPNFSGERVVPITRQPCGTSSWASAWALYPWPKENSVFTMFP